MSNFELTDYIATKDEINQKCDHSQRVEVLAAARQLLESDSEKIFMLDLAAGFPITLPALEDAKSGWRARFIVKTAPTGGNVVIAEEATKDTNVIAARIPNVAGAAGEESAACTYINFIANQAVIADWVEIYCDGDAFYATGIASVAAGITVT